MVAAMGGGGSWRSALAAVAASGDGGRCDRWAIVDGIDNDSGGEGNDQWRRCGGSDHYGNRGHGG